MRPSPRPVSLVALLACLLALPAAAASEVSDVMKVQRPEGGEHFGLYLMGKKVGYLYQDVGYVPGSTDKVRSRTETFFRAKVGQNVVERSLNEVRIYEAKPRGRLLSFTVEAKGDGGDQTLQATATAAGYTVVQRRPGLPNQVRQLKESGERVEDADQVRLALLWNKRVEGTLTDGQDLQTYQVTTTPEPPAERVVAGVKVKLRKVVTLSNKEKIPIEVFVADTGEIVEMNLGNAMLARAESEPVARRLDTVEIFGLTRVVLPRPLSPAALAVPGAIKLVMSGLPKKFQVNSARQSFRPLSPEEVEVTIRAPALAAGKRPKLPLRDPHGGIYSKSSIIVESDHPEIQALAKEILAGEQEGVAAAKKITTWVYRNIKKGYGTSSDRATDVLRARKGDCTEHSLLAVTLMRAAGIPAKRVDGLVYMMTDDGVPALYWHEWVEAFVGEWVQMDPTFGEEIASAGHFAVGEEGNAEIVPLIGQLRVIAVR